MRKLPPWLSILLRLLIAAIFIYAGIVKANAPVRFATDIANYHMLPWNIGVRLAFYLPWLEIVCALAILLTALRRGALWILLTLSLVFIVAAVAAKARGLDVSCGCFGHLSESWSFTRHLMVDLLIFGALAALLLVDRPKRSLLLN